MKFAWLEHPTVSYAVQWIDLIYRYLLFILLINSQRKYMMAIITSNFMVPFTQFTDFEQSFFYTRALEHF